MQTNELTRERLRQLAELRPEGARVLSVYLNLDPAEFATPAARSTEVRSLVGEAARRLEEADGLSRDETSALREDIERVREFLEGDDFSAEGAHALAIFSAGPADLFEVIKLPRPTESQVFIDDSPLIEPLADQLSTGSWCVLLVNRREGRLLRGTANRLEELPGFRREVHGGADEGSGTTSRGGGAVSEEVRSHFRQVGEALQRRLKRGGCERLLVGCHEETWGAVQDALPAPVVERIVARMDVDVENATPEQVLEAAAEPIAAEDRRRERETLDVLEQGLGTGGRGAAGLGAVLAALTEQRVETLLLAEGFAAPGVVCRSCGWAGVEADTCPVDAGELEPREDVVESAMERALTQSADVMTVHHHDDLDRHDGIAAVLRW